MKILNLNENEKKNRPADVYTVEPLIKDTLINGHLQ